MSNSFLQSNEWEEFQSSIGRTTFRVDEKLIIKYSLPVGFNYLYSPRPIFKSKEDLKNFINQSEKLAKKESSIFLRIEPDLNPNLDFSSLQPTTCHLQPTKSIQPQDTLMLDLNHTEETLLKNMHPKTRYNIKVAKKKNIKITKSINPDDIDIFYNLALGTSKRDNFNYHSKAYYKQMMKILGPKNMIKLYISYLPQESIHNSKFNIQDSINTPTAAILVLFYNNSAIYLHGASDHQYRSAMSPYLLQWEAIIEAKKRNFKTYDFWGVAPLGDHNHSWSGITKFKTGFNPNGEIIHYPNCQEVIFNSFWYNLYKLSKSVKK